MRTAILTAAAILLAGVSAPAFPYNYDGQLVELEAWLESSPGASQHETALVLSFSDGTDLAYGYRWNDGDAVARGTGSSGGTIGAATGEAMLLMLNARPEATVDYGYFAFGSQIFVNTITVGAHTMGTDVFGLTDWAAYWVSDDGLSWSAPYDYGATGRTLTDGIWDGWASQDTSAESGDDQYNPNSPPVVPLASPNAIPEPASATLAVLGILALALGRRRG